MTAASLPRTGGGLGVLAACLRRDWEIARSYRLAFVLDLASSLVLLASLYFLGVFVDRVSDRADPAQGRGYFAFVLVGLMLLRIAQSAMSSLATRVRTEQTTGTLEVLFTSPSRPSLIALGSALYDVLYAAASSLALLVLAGLFFQVRFNTSPAAAAAAVLALIACVVLFTAFGVALAAFTLVFKQTLPMLALAIPALTLLGGVYFPIDVLPGALEIVARWFPFYWATDSLRAAVFDAEVQVAHVSLLVGSAFVGLPVAMRVFHAALARTRKMGTLTQY